VARTMAGSYPLQTLDSRSIFSDKGAVTHVATEAFGNPSTCAAKRCYPGDR
jgi:hypothetical protein